jgi:hypothetical protein
MYLQIVTGTGPMEKVIVGNLTLETNVALREDEALIRAEASKAICTRVKYFLVWKLYFERATYV